MSFIIHNAKINRINGGNRQFHIPGGDCKTILDRILSPQKVSEEIKESP